MRKAFLISAALLLASWAPASATVYTFTGEFTGGGSAGDISQIQDYLPLAPTPFVATFTFGPDSEPADPGLSEYFGTLNLKVGSAPVIVGDVLATGFSGHVPVFHSHFHWPDDNSVFELSLFTSPHNPPVGGAFILDENFFDPSSENKVSLSVGLSTLHQQHFGGIGLFDPTFDVTVSGEPLRIEVVEPSTWSFLILGFAGLGLAVRRFRSGSALKPC